MTNSRRVATAVSLILVSFAAAQTTKPARVRPVAGTVVSIDAGKLVIHPRQPADGDAVPDVTVTADESATVMVDGFRGTLADVKPGMTVTVRQMPARDASPAETLITALSPGLNGVIEKIEATQLTVTTRQRDGTSKTTVVSIDDKTEFLGVAVFEGAGRRLDSAVKGKDDAKVGMRVRVIPETGTATKIYVLTTPPKASTAPATTRSTKAV